MYVKIVVLLLEEVYRLVELWVVFYWTRSLIFSVDLKFFIKRYLRKNQIRNIFFICFSLLKIEFFCIVFKRNTTLKFGSAFFFCCIASKFFLLSVYIFIILYLYVVLRHYLVSLCEYQQCFKATNWRTAVYRDFYTRQTLNKNNINCMWLCAYVSSRGVRDQSTEPTNQRTK